MSEPKRGGGGGGGLALGTAIAWGVCALLVGLAADVLQPLGPFVAFLLGVFLVVAALCALLSFFPGLRGMMAPATIVALWGVFVFGGILALQHIVTPAAGGKERGFLAAFGPGEVLQNLVLAEAARREPPPEAAKPAVIAEAATAEAPEPDALAALRGAVLGPEPSARLRAALDALKAEDPALLAASIDVIYRSGDPALRQAAVVALLAQRRGAGLPLLVMNADAANQDFAQALQGAAIRLTSVNERAGAFEGELCGAAGMTGTVNRTGVAFSGACRVGEADTRVVVALLPTDDYRLLGEARNNAGQVVRVELTLR